MTGAKHTDIIENDFQFQLPRACAVWSCVKRKDMENNQQPPHSTRIPTWLDSLQASGYRITGSLRAVVEVIATSNFICSPMEIYLQAARQYPGLGLVTVYRTLEKLEDLGLVERVHREDGCHSYIAAAEGHQHLLICTNCKRAEHFSGDDLSPLMAELGTTRGFHIQGHWLQLFGLCRDCQCSLEEAAQ